MSGPSGAETGGAGLALRVAARIAGRELRGGVRGFRIFLACLTLGIAAITAVGLVRESIQAGIAEQGAVLLGGDAEIELTYRFATEAELAVFRGLASEVSEIVDFRSMAVVERDGAVERGLTQVKAVDAAYPLYGAVRLDPEMPLAEAFAGRDGLPGGVMDRVLMDRLGLAPGDRFRLGRQDFVLMAVLERQPDEAGGGFDLGPPTLVRTADLARSELLQPGTLFETDYRLKLAEGLTLDEARTRVETDLGPGLRWRDSRDGAPGLSRFVDRLSAFLVLVGLAGLAVGGVGVAAAVGAHLERKTETIATLKTLGAERRTIFLVYAMQIGVLSGLGIVLGLALGAALPLVFGPVIQARLPLPAVLALHPAPLAEAALYGLLSAAIFTLWPLARTEDIRAAQLFRDSVGPGRRLPRAPFLAVLGLLLAVLVGSAALLSGLAWLTLWAALGIAGAFLALIGAAWLVRRIARRLSRLAAGRTALRLALGSIGGAGGQSASVVLSLGLGLSVLAAVGQIDVNLRGAIQRELPDRAPSYFMVDIQPDQIEGFRTRLEGDPGVAKVETAPMLRGIITQINGRPARETAGEHWVIRGDRGVTYSRRPTERTEITAGEWWPPDYDGPPQISFAAEEAAEIGLRLGDTMTVNILGRDITGTVTSFRNVDFSTAGIGFVLSMNPSALQGAPHSFIATVYAEETAEAAILRDLANAYPNITAIRVRDAIDRVTEVLGSIAAAITWAALVTLVTGAAVLVGAAAAGQRARSYEAAILKTLGAERRTILASFALRWAILGAAAGAVAVAAGGTAGWAVSRFVMETEFAFAPLSALAVVAGGVVLTLAAGLAFAWRPLAARPSRVLRARE